MKTTKLALKDKSGKDYMNDPAKEAGVSKNPKVKVIKDDLTYVLTRALRKACDSKATSLMYNIFYRLNPDEAKVVADHFWDVVEDATFETIAQKVRASAEDLYGDSGRNAVALCIHFMDDVDIQCMFSYVYHG